ncbi:hypothetical protein HWV62_32158 [Athelia sp. TMB]|nr:hypothetical protein HWV62_32158 [Athelia sp. TMB]
MSAPARRAGRPLKHVLQAESTSAPVERVDIGIYPSSDGRRILQDAPSPPRKRQRVIKPQHLDDDFATWEPSLEGPIEEVGKAGVASASGEAGAASGETGMAGTGERPTTATTSNQVTIDPAAVRKRYLSSDYPMLIWRQGHITEFLHELIRHEGLREHRHGAVCATCRKPVPIPQPRSPGDEADDDETADNEAADNEPADNEKVGDEVSDDEACSDTPPPGLMRCEDCFGDCVECVSCCLERHARLPLHRTKEWTGNYWRKKSLKKLSLVVQLGHPGTICHTPDKAFSLTVLDSHGIHVVAACYCKCERSLRASRRAQLLRAGWYPASVTDPGTCATFRVLEEFHLQNLKGALNVHNWIGAVEMRTDGMKIAKTPDREKALSRIFRQWAFLKRLKRSGRGHDPSGVASTKPGECAVLCWACPQEGKNLPGNWQDVDDKYKFLYMLILAMDANFRLTNRLRANEHDDPELGPGWGCTVAPAPYKEHLKNYVSEVDITTCIAFMALLQKDSKMTTGLRTSGVGACMCACHEVFRPCGVADLQKGERYSNMDYVFFSSIMFVVLLSLAISYDIVCQWKINLPDRSRKMPADIQQNHPDSPPLEERIRFGVPIWHAAAHEDQCQMTNSLRYQPGMGHTDGEGIERGWSRINPHASSTKEMGQGARHDTLDDIFNHHNWERNIMLGDMLAKRLIIAKEERDVQLKAFKEIRDTVNMAAAEQWIKDVTAWESERKLPVKEQKAPNPYELPTKDGITEAQVRLELRKEETGQINEGRGALHETSATGFLVMGLHIEGLQRQIAANVSHPANLTANQASLIEERRLQVWRKLRVLRDMQRVYMPCATNILNNEDELCRAKELPPLPAESVRLWMPSDLPADIQQSGCVANLATMELKLRVAQCYEALDAMRASLNAKKHLINRRNKNSTGQKKATRSRTLIDRVADRIATQSRKYKRAREALFALGGVEEYGARFKALLEEHLVLDGEELQDDHEATRLMNRAGGAVRREYLKARARKHRWVEEVALLTEEMRRVLRFLTWRSHWWLERETEWDGLDADVTDGLRAYSRRQAASYAHIMEHFRSQWDQKAVRAARDTAFSTPALLGLEDTIMT